MTNRLFAIAALTALAGCATPASLPPKAPPAVEVLVPVIQPCEVEQVPLSPLPSASRPEGDIYEAAKSVLADRKTLLADRAKLKAANTDPCPPLETLK